MSIPIPQRDPTERRSNGHRLRVDPRGSIRAGLHNHRAVSRNGGRPLDETRERILKRPVSEPAGVLVNKYPTNIGIEERYRGAIQVAQVRALTDLILPLGIVWREHRDGFCARRTIARKTRRTAG